MNGGKYEESIILDSDVHFAICMVMPALATDSEVVSLEDAQRATIADCNIVLSNINKTGASASSPGTNTTKTIVGKSISPGYAMIKLTDLKYLGAETQVVGNYYYVTINGQTIVFTNSSASYSSSTPYTLNKPEGGTQSYTFSVGGTTETDAKAQLIDGVPYVRLTDAAHQCGALLVTYNSSENAVYVFHFRVNGNTAHADDNTYIVGGAWLDNWSSKGTTQLAPHFKVNELWASSTTGTYNCQLKISAASLQTEENVRYCGFLYCSKVYFAIVLLLIYRQKSNIGYDILVEDNDLYKHIGDMETLPGAAVIIASFKGWSNHRFTDGFDWCHF